MINRAFFSRNSLEIAPELLGKTLVSRQLGLEIGGVINEIEVYREDDPASHSFGGKQTPRTKIMFGPPGHAYIYFVYGMYYCFNIVTEEDGRGAAILIRGILPKLGLEKMREHRPNAKTDQDLCNGPGKLTMALGLLPEHNGIDLLSESSPIQIREGTKPSAIEKTPRIGISKATEKPWRFIAHFES